MILGALQGVHVGGAHEHRSQQPGESADLVAERRIGLGPLGDVSAAYRSEVLWLAACELVVDGEPFTFTVDGGLVDVKAGQAKSPDATLTTSYEPMIAVADGQMSLDEFSRRHLELSGSNPEKAQALAQLMGRAMSHMAGAAA